MFTTVAGFDLIAPTVRQRAHPGDFGIEKLQSERCKSLAVCIGLQPNRVAVGQGDCAWIVEATYPSKGSVTVIERTILLHQDHHVFGVEISRTRGRING